jgi:hypothetical protein
MTKFSVVLLDGSVHTVDGSSLRVEYDGGVQDIPFTEVTAILATVNAGQQISAQMALIESIGDIGPVQEDELDSLDEQLSGVISRLFGMPEGDDSCQHDCDHCTSCHDSDPDDNQGEADGTNPIEEIHNATIIQFPGK